METIIRPDYMSVSSLIYLISLTSIFLLTFIYGHGIVLDLTTNFYAYLLFIAILTTTYVIFLGLYYLNWTLESVFIAILLMSILFSFIAFLLMYFGQNICQEVKDETNIMKYVVIILLFIVFYLGFYHRDYTTWDLVDTIKFIIMLIIIRLLYYLVKKYDLPLLKTIVDITLITVLFIKGRHMYNIFSLNN